MAARFLLHKMRALLEEAMESGSLEKREYEDAIREVGLFYITYYIYIYICNICNIYIHTYITYI